MVAGHAATIASDAEALLTNCRGATQWLLDRTLDGSRRFMTPDELIKHAKLH